jgi:hypothetical protein
MGQHFHIFGRLMVAFLEEKLKELKLGKMD